MPETITPDKDKQLETVDLNGVEVFSEGTFNGDTYSGDDLQAMIDAYPHAGFQPTVKAGHADGQDDEKKARQVFGAPALGYVSKLYRSGKKLLADITAVPRRFAELIKAGAYKRVSSEIYWDYKDDASGKKFPRVLKSVAFLGVDIPAITSLKEIEALYQKNEAGALYAYDEKGNEFRAYDCGPYPVAASMGISDYLTLYPRKSKESANYREAETGSRERCLNCKFFIPGYSACSVVEGRIEPSWTSDFFELRVDLIQQFARHKKDDARNYTIEKRDDEYCLIAGDGKVLGCHDSREGAEAQERAVQASKNNSREEFSLSVEKVRELCAPCADKMEFRGIKAVKIYRGADGKYQVNLPQATIDSLCAKFGGEEGFRTACMGSEVAADMNDPGAFCNALKQSCFSAKAGERTYAMEITEKDGQFCVMDGEETVKCYPTRAEAEAHMKEAKMQKGGPGMDEKKFAEMKAQAKADLEAKEVAIKKDYDEKMAALKADAEKREKEQGEKIKTLERQRFDDQNKQWIKDQKAAGHLAPVEEPRILAIFSELFEDTRIVKFSRGGKEATETLMQSVKSFVEDRPTIFGELSKPGDDLPIETDNVGEEVDRLTVKWMNDKNVKEYGQAMKAVLAQKENAGLAQKYLRMQKQ